jgi:3'(2'), 5'-bisphosphate nucleotidase
MKQLDATQLERLCAIAQDAGREVMAVYSGDFDAVEKADGSPLTRADLAADRVIRAGLVQAFPGAEIVSEESSPDIAGASDRFFLVDPLDGTREFVARIGEFTVNIALVEDGRTVAGVVFAPVSGELYAGGAGLGAFRRTAQGQRPIRTAPSSPEAPLRVLGSRFHRSGATDAWLQQLARPTVITTVGSSLKFCRIAEGAADLYVRHGPTSQWDTAAGQAVLEAAGGAALVAPGVPLAYGRDRPVINPDFIALADGTLPFPPLA